MRSMSRMGFALSLFVIFHSSRYVFSQELLPWSIHGNVGLGGFLHGTQIQPDYAGLFDLSVNLRCHAGTFCQKYRPQIFTSSLRFAFNADSRMSSYVPYVDAKLRGISLVIKPWLHLGVGVLGFQRNPKFLDTTANLTAQIGEVWFGTFREFRLGFWEVGFRMDILGVKYVGHFTSIPPFEGMALFGVVPSVQLQIGKKRVKGEFIIHGGLQTSVGQSGNGTSAAPRDFGKMLLEPWVDVRARLRVRLEEQTSSTLEWYLQGDFRYQTFVDYGTQSNDIGYFVSATTGILLP